MTTAFSFLFVLGVLVFVHELGHFLVARWHGVRVLTFSLGFGPKLVKFQRGGTEYCISVIPLGGYVKLAGETVEEARTGAPDEFLSKSKFVRFQVYIAGPIMNILLAIVVLAGVLSQGADVPLYESSAAVVGTVKPGSPAEAAGIQPRDVLVSVDGESIPSWDALYMAVVPRAKRELLIGVERGSERFDVRVTPNAVGRYEIGDLGVGPVERPQVLQVTPGPAERAGMQAGDVLLALNGQRGLPQAKIIEQIRAHANKELTFTIERQGRELDVKIVPEGPEGAALIGDRKSVG